MNKAHRFMDGIGCVYHAACTVRTWLVAGMDNNNNIYLTAIGFSPGGSRF